MACSAEVLRGVPLFSNLDDDELQVLAGQVELRQFAARQRIFRISDPGERAYIVVSGEVRVTVLDEDQQEIVLQEPVRGDYFGFASMLEQTPHQAEATAVTEVSCIEMDRQDFQKLFEQRPHAMLDIMAFLGRQLHNAHQLARARSCARPMKSSKSNTRLASESPTVAAFGGSWSFIILFLVVMTVYTIINIVLGGRAWDPYPFILLNLFLSALAAIQAPVIMMSQNRQDKKDRIRSEMDFDVNRHARVELQGVAQKLNNIGDRIGDIEELLRDKVK